MIVTKRKTRGMARGLLAEKTAGICDILNRCEQLIRERLGWSLHEVCAAEQFALEELRPPSLTALQIALTEGWRERGVEPDAAGGGAVDFGIRTLFTCGAPLDERTAAALEQTFGAPLRTSYGATECGGISINPLPPAVRKRGSVGVSVGPEIRIVDAAGERLPVGQLGEVLVRGPGVFRGYEADPNNNANTFFGEWYRTGDQGYLDGDGYLFLAGRIQETINRGGEKIAPVEIEQVLCSHPAVEEAAVFAIAHPVFGEDVAAAVILKQPAPDANEIRRFASERLSAFKVPGTLLIVREIPKGPTGKVQRKRLAVLFADKLARFEEFPSPVSKSFRAPRSQGSKPTSQP